MVTDDHRPKVLIIDNKEEILAKVQPGLSEDYAIFQAHNGTAAIDISLKEDISIVLLDLELDSPSANNGNTGLCTLEQIIRSEEHTSELQSLRHLVCRLLLEKQ